MPEKDKPFVVTDRRKFTLDGTPRPDADPSPAREPRDVTPPPPTAIEPPLEFKTRSAEPAADQQPSLVVDADPLPGEDADLPPQPTPAEMDQAYIAYQQTAIVQLGGTTQEGQQPKVDLMGARQSIDMLGILSEKTRGNLSPAETLLMDNALFEVRMGFLEVTQALARSAANRQPPGAGAPNGAPGRPSIVR